MNDNLLIGTEVGPIVGGQVRVENAFADIEATLITLLVRCMITSKKAGSQSLFWEQHYCSQRLY